MHKLIISLLPILSQVESNNNPDAVGDFGKAIGVLQIHKIVVDDVNRILGGPTFNYISRYDASCSRHIATNYLIYYGKAYEVKTGKKVTAEVLARIWNGGPLGWQKKSTLKYWEKCKHAMNRKRVVK